MARKYRKTEINGIVNPDTRMRGQYKHSHTFCVNCHGLNTHYPKCTKNESYAIPATAEVPPKESNKRKWDIFKAQFVYVKISDNWWSGYSYSWWNLVGSKLK
jgi:hypothetical protein